MSSKSIDDLRSKGKHYEAKDLADTLLQENPNDADLNFKAARVNDYLGYTNHAISFYEIALKNSLNPEKVKDALLSLGSSYRALGDAQKSEKLLIDASIQFPHANDIKVFLAMAMYCSGKHQQAFELLLELLVATSADPSILQYKKSIKFYAQDIGRVWSEKSI